jgi:amino acid transporter
MLAVFILTPASEVANRLNAFSAALGGSSTFVADARAAAESAGVNLNPAFSLIATLLIAPIAWTSLQWATYSAQQNGEIKSAGSFRDQLLIIVGSLILTGLLLALLALVLENTVGTEFLYVAGAGYWSGVGEASLAGSYLWPNIIATALANNPIVTLLIAAGFILNGHQIVHNCYIGMTRVMVAMSLDRVLPEMVSRVSDRLRTPVNAHVIYFVASLPVIWLYNNFAYGEGDEAVSWASLTLGVTFACGYVFVGTAIAGALLPFRAKALYEASPGAAYKVAGIPLVTIVGVLGALAGIWFLWTFLTSPELGLTSDLAYYVVGGILLFSLGWYLVTYYVRRQAGINVGYAFKEVPPE